jgi:diketogulonate reductase-like aldo/keto reductase
LPGRYQAYDKAVTTIQESLYRANLDYYDLYLIHWPNPKQDTYVEAWQALIDAKKWGLIRSIGVCNFLPEHIERLEKETGVKPSTNQIELHPFFNQAEQRKWHEENNIKTESWSPLARASEVLHNDTIQSIANNHNKSVSQVILRWHYQLGAISIPKSASPVRQLENISIFDFTLSETEMNMISGLTRSDGRLKNQDPATYEEF